jgi:hypothetical protein
MRGIVDDPYRRGPISICSSTFQLSVAQFLFVVDDGGHCLLPEPS